MMRAICQICEEFYALVDVDDFVETSGETGLTRTVKALRYPLTGEMFGSPDAVHSVPAPFHPSLDFEAMRCPYGRTHRPMVQDDAVLTYKGIVKLPKDGSKAYLDMTSSTEVDRHSIGDRVMQVPDEEAERMARAALVVESKEPIPPLYVYEVTVDPEKSAWICATCGKSFDKQRSLQGHMMSHKKKPEPPPPKAPVKKKRR